MRFCTNPRKYDNERESVLTGQWLVRAIKMRVVKNVIVS